MNGAQAYDALELGELAEPEGPDPIGDWAFVAFVVLTVANFCLVVPW